MIAPCQDPGLRSPADRSTVSQALPSSVYSIAAPPWTSAVLAAPSPSDHSGSPIALYISGIIKKELCSLLRSLSNLENIHFWLRPATCSNFRLAQVRTTAHVLTTGP